MELIKINKKRKGMDLMYLVFSFFIINSEIESFLHILQGCLPKLYSEISLLTTKQTSTIEFFPIVTPFLILVCAPINKLFIMIIGLDAFLSCVSVSFFLFLYQVNIAQLILFDKCIRQLKKKGMFFFVRVSINQ